MRRRARAGDKPVKRQPRKPLKRRAAAEAEFLASSSAQELHEQVGALRRELAECASEAEGQALRRRLSELEQFIALRLEGMRATGKL